MRCEKYVYYGPGKSSPCPKPASGESKDGPAIEYDQARKFELL